MERASWKTKFVMHDVPQAEVRTPGWIVAFDAGAQRGAALADDVVVPTRPATSTRPSITADSVNRVERIPIPPHVSSQPALTGRLPNPSQENSQQRGSRVYPGRRAAFGLISPRTAPSSPCRL